MEAPPGQGFAQAWRPCSWRAAAWVPLLPALTAFLSPSGPALSPGLLGPPELRCPTSGPGLGGRPTFSRFIRGGQFTAGSRIRAQGPGTDRGNSPCGTVLGFRTLLQLPGSTVSQDSCAWRPAAGWLSSSLTTVPVLHPGRILGLGHPWLHLGHVYSPQLPAPGSPEDTSSPPLLHRTLLFGDRLGPWPLPLLSLESLGLGKYWGGGVCNQGLPSSLLAQWAGAGLGL